MIIQWLGVLAKIGSEAPSSTINWCEHYRRNSRPGLSLKYLSFLWKKNEKSKSPQQWDVSRSQQPCGGLPSKDMLISVHFFCKAHLLAKVDQALLFFLLVPTVHMAWKLLFQDIHGWKWKPNNDNWTHCFVLNTVTFLADFPVVFFNISHWCLSLKALALTNPHNKMQLSRTIN